jgi:hypothetical protein
VFVLLILATVLLVLDMSELGSVSLRAHWESDSVIINPGAEGGFLLQADCLTVGWEGLSQVGVLSSGFWPLFGLGVFSQFGIWNSLIFKILENQADRHLENI